VLIFNFVLILLAAVIMSNLINRFLPSLSLPILQIILGVLISIIPYGAFGFEFELEPELFFVLFLSPLVFHSVMTANKRTMRHMIKPILMAALGLVFITIIVVGYFLHLLVASVPLAAAFALAAALGPTDIVAVEAVAHRVSLPRRIISILSGESIINDATGIVCFQFAIVAITTGSFIIWHGLARFFVLAVGGLLVGLVMTALKYMLVRWLQYLDINYAPLHISIGILTPFIIYMVAEAVSVSGILAVFFAGLVHSVFSDRFNPELINLKKAQENVWSVLSYSLDGLVFVILGTQLFRIFQEYAGGMYDFNWRQIAVYVLLISLALLVTRFLWWIITVRRKTYDDAETPTGKIKSGMIFSVAGARGAVSMASVMSIPLLLPDGTEFPERDMIILIASGVIVISLLMTNFILPLFAKKRTETPLNEIEQETRVEILETVAKRLKEAATPENYAATAIVARNYYTRMNQRPKKGHKRQKHNFRRNVLFWEKDVIMRMAETEQISKAMAEHYIEESNRLMAESDKKKNTLGWLISTVWHFIHSFAWRAPKFPDREHLELKNINELAMRKTLKELNLAEDDPVAAIIAAEHEKVVSARLGMADSKKTRFDYHRSIYDVAVNGFHMERVLIQQMLEAGRLSWKTAKEMQANIIMLEAQLQAE
jgi:CPA1 family monovalent cation:H+ antiporter